MPRLLFLSLALALACKPSSSSSTPEASSPGAASAIASWPTDYSPSQACATADSLLHLWAGATAIDSAFDLSSQVGADSRPGCQVAFRGLARVGVGLGDSLLHHWTTRGAAFAPRYQADGIGDNLSGVVLGRSLCLLNTTLDMRDESEDGPIQASDTVGVTVSCVARIDADTAQAAT